LGFKTITCCVNDAYLKEDSVGVEITPSFINTLPLYIDPCGENGEYHTFCYAGPVFKTTITFTVGEKVYKPLEIKNSQQSSDLIVTKGFWFCDLIPK
jgi:diphthamide synthase (EF-2-diphthine--ammonia ligase)